jgi:hypothetical protein
VLRVNAARNLALSIFNALRDSSSPEAFPKITPAAIVGARHGVPLREDAEGIFMHSGGL